MTDTSPDEPQTPLTDEHLSHLNLLDGNKVGIPIETVALLRQLELASRGSLRIIDEMGVELRKAQDDYVRAREFIEQQANELRQREHNEK